MRIKSYQFKQLFVALLAAPLLMVGFNSTPAQTGDDAAVTYKAKCVACHGAKAEKKFDTTKTDDKLVEAILVGAKSEKPPNMPGYEAKGINGEQAKALLAYMKSLRQ